MIVLEGITVQFGGIRPLDALSAELSAPVTGLVGPNGAGKTTLMNVLSGFVRPRAGAAAMDGVALLALSPVRRVRHGLRRLFQQEMLAPELTVWESLAASADQLCPGRAAGDRAIRAALDFVGLADREDVGARDLDLLERRLVEIAKALIGPARVLLLDEPAAGLSDSESAVLRRVICDIPTRFGAQVLLIDHDADLIAETCSETLVLDFGRKLAFGPTRAVLDEPAVRHAYFGKV